MSSINLPGPPRIDDIDSAPTTLPVPANTDWEQKYNQISERFTKVSDDNFTLKEENARLRSTNGTRELLDQLIKPYARAAFIFMCVYCGFVAIALICHGFSLGFGLPDGVLQLLVGSTAVTVIGLVGMVLTGVFIGARKG